MRSPLRLLVMTLAVGLLAAGSAQAVTTTSTFTPTPFTKATAGAGNAVLATFNWKPVIWDPTSPTDKQDVLADALDGGASNSASLGATNSTVPLLLSDGRLYRVRIIACQVTATCSTVANLEVSADTRIDATPPSGTVQVNGGAVATNSPNVTLNLAASDPLINGIAGSSSGVTQAAVDRDGDGTFPCSFIFNDPNPDFTGCAGNFNPATPATLTAGDGVKTVGVKFGDGARTPPAPCTNIFCVVILGSPILGNESAIATDTILLDTVKPLALFTQSGFVVDRGASVTFDATSSVDQSPATASGVDLATATWQFKDGTPQATGATVSHVFNQVGTFVGELRVRDRAGNLSDARPFSVTVNPGPGGSTAGGGSIGGITGTAAFKLDRLRVRARYVRSRLKGSIALTGSSTRAGALRAELRRTARGRVLGRIVAKRLKVGAFTRTLKLPAKLLPGTYRLAFIGPGGTLRTTLTLRPPREGVIRSGRISLSGGRASVLFRLAAQPVKALRGGLTVAWSQGSRKLGTVAVSSGARIRASLPGGASLASGALRAELRAGSTVVGSATIRVR
jgi:hypothetical protein